MIGKNEQLENDNTNAERANLMSEKRKFLQDTSEKVKEEVRLCFEQLARVLRTRERQLLRQIEAVHNQQLSIVQTNLEIPYSLPSIRVNLSEKRELEESILKFGEFSTSDRNVIDVRDAEPYKIEDYVEANRDHVTLDKSIRSEREKERIIVEESNDKFDDSLNIPYDLSFNTSSETDVTSENEITVLMSENYCPSVDGLARKKDDSLNKKNHELLNNSPKWELKIIAQTIRRNEDYIVPETVINSKFETSDETMKENREISSPDRDENPIFSSYESESPLDNFPTNDEPPMTSKKSQDSEKHPKQIQQWLEQILVETETEPTIHEIEQFAEISKSRFKEFQFPLET